MSVENYKCPGCGAPVVFKPELGGFKCNYCYSTFTEEEITKHFKELSDSESEAEEVVAGEGEIKQYSCSNCGAQVVAGDTSTTAFCYYCHSPVVITARLKGKFKPDRIIPFKINKEEAVQTFLKWAKGKKFVPRDFTSTMQQEKISGIYLPYWTGDVVADIDYHAIGNSVSVSRSGSTEYTTTKKFQIDRTGKAEINNIQEIAFSKIDRNLLNGITPFEEEEEKEFSAGYMAGFFSEQYDIDEEHINPEIMTRAKQNTLSMIQNSIECGSLEDVEDNTNYELRDMRYTLLPSWILTYLYKGKTYVFAINGQTGKANGELPLSKPKLWFSALRIAAIIATALLLGGRFIW
ncbi:MAG: hypothetical protein CR988_05190 [Treponema sp.]|nr:MAG: hypothetical protein CR988_05190 [Treponema sp.]